MPNSANAQQPRSQQQPNQRVLLINGVNLNLLGKREPEIYGHQTLADIEQQLTQQADAANAELICIQSNHEGELVDAIQHHTLLVDAEQQVDAIIINPAAFTHTSVAIRDALLAANKPIVEVHLSNIHRREAFRQHSYVSDIAVGVICGLGYRGYAMALDYLLQSVHARNR